jgi:hypothetical protein
MGIMSSSRTRITRITRITHTPRTERSSTRTEHAAGWTRTVRGPWVVICAVAGVVLGPAAVTASALDQANAAPPLRIVKPDRTQAYIPSDTTRRRTA